MQFAQDTEYERYVVSTFNDVIVGAEDDSARFEIIDGKRVINVGITAKIGGLSAGSLAPFRPLVFGASFKLLDLLIEHTLDLNSIPGTLRTFQQKVQLVANTPSTMPTPIVPDTFERLAALYRHWMEVRHALVHREADVDSNGTITERKSGVSVTSEQQDAFCQAVHITSNLVSAGNFDSRLENEIRWHLDSLSNAHSLPIMGARAPQRPVPVYAFKMPAEPGDTIKIDPISIRTAIEQQWPGREDYVDLEFVITSAQVDTFRGRLEDLPKATVELDPSNPPGWLIKT